MNNNSNMKTYKIIKEIIFALFVLKKTNLEKCKKNCSYIIMHNFIYNYT